MKIYHKQISRNENSRFFFQPEYLRSPTWVLHFQKGNSFECATLLVSLLLGQGYNAFVVSGYASREQVFCDMTRRTCPYLPEEEQALPPPADVRKISKYQLKAPPDFKSQFLLELENREKERVEAELQREKEERQRMIAESERPQPDEYFGHRIHAWVVILPEENGLRSEEIIEPIFIEPSSGVSYNPLDDETNSLYLGVESIWNDRNYWVNMQPRGSCAEINWDLSNVKFWEHLLPGEPYVIQKDTDKIDEDVEAERNKHLDMPASYVNEIRIHSIDLERRYPGGGKTIFYKKAKVELYAPYVQPDGLIQRVTVYEDYEYTTPVESYEKYLNRSDGLTETKRNFDTDTITDLFEVQGRSDHCKAHRYLASKNDSIDSERVVDFYDSAQFDGLSRIEMAPLHFTQHYVDREDFLYYRHTQFSADKGNPADGIHFRRIAKIIEKYHRTEATPACKNVAVREFTMNENEIRIKFHYDKDQSSAATRTFIKPSIADREDRLVFNPAMTHGYNPDPTAPPEKELDLFYDINKYLRDEDDAVSCIRGAETEVAAFIKRRADENSNLQLTISLFDENRIVETIAELGVEPVKRPSKRDDELEINPLGPYLARIGNPAYISKAEAFLLRDDCLNDFKEWSVEKANRILRTIEERAAQLEKTQAVLTQTEDLSKTEEEQMLAKISEISFNLHVLERYLNRHRDSVPERYKILVDRLQQNPRLQALKKS
ncbi:dynein regulatory complex subunit 7 [Ooceraea biroi]|uniref:dynein regulatory complex subunit 7 n=1 Tax=Ooceraea biroi TaxID=2015173 RepID=UPI0005B9E36F|nr:dynein regulatory complex subunit 7 [Ooceraea biroi]